MKKILIATTALVATAGMAAAEINFAGSARFGVRYDESAVAGVQETKITNRFTLKITGTAETDSGIEFFGHARIRGGNTGSVTTDVKPSSVGAPRVGAKMGGLTVATGNINGAIDSMAGLYGGTVGLTGLGYGNVLASGVDGFSSGGSGKNGVEVIYSMSGLNFHLSQSSLTAGDRTAVAVSYAFGDWTVALGNQSADVAAEDQTIMTVGGSIGSVSVGLQVADVDGNSAHQINASFDVGAGTNVTVYVADTDGASDTAYGVGFTHSLGGATLAGGIVSDAAGATHADLGVRFKF